MSDTLCIQLYAADVWKRCLFSPFKCVGAVEEDWCQVHSIQGSVTRRADASQGQTGGEQVHDTGKLVTHLHMGEGRKEYNQR